MHPNDVQKWRKRRPFEPFYMEISTGERFSVRHPETLFVGPTSCHLVFVSDEMYEDFVDLALIHIVRIGRDRPTSNGRSRKRGKP